MSYYVLLELTRDLVKSRYPKEKIEESFINFIRFENLCNLYIKRDDHMEGLMEFFEEYQKEIEDWLEENAADLISAIIEIGKEAIGSISIKKEQE